MVDFTRDSYTLAFDRELMKPGCALLQAALGGTLGIANLFPSETWIVFPTPELKLYLLTKRQLLEVVSFVKGELKCEQ